METILVITVILNTLPQVLEVKPFSEWMCNIIAGSIKEKIITINNNQLVIQKLECKSV